MDKKQFSPGSISIDSEIFEKQIRSVHIPPAITWICSICEDSFSISLFVCELEDKFPLLVRQLLKLADLFECISVRSLARVSEEKYAGLIIHSTRNSFHISWAEALSKSVGDFGNILFEAGNSGGSLDSFFSQAALQSRVLRNLQLVSRYMLTSSDLDMLQHIFLTGITAGYGLGFNRAVLFIYDEMTACLSAEKAIGSLTREEAQGIWELIEYEDQSIEDFIRRYVRGDHFIDSSLLGVIDNVCIYTKKGEELDEKYDEPLQAFASEGISVFSSPVQNELIRRLNPGDTYILAPIRSHERLWGMVFMDNAFSKREYSDDLLSMTELFINQTALIWENYTMLQSYRKEASLDSLTGVANRNEMDKILDYLFSIDKPDLRFFMLLMDIDYFKQINDENGHAFGDRVLVEYSKILKSVVRSDDFVARYGGDEFLILIRDVSRTKLEEIADRLRKEIHERLSETVSIGVASYPQDSRSRIELFKQADEALYEAKHQGRDRVIFYSDMR